MAIYAYDEVEPRFKWQVTVDVSQYLEAVGIVGTRSLITVLRKWFSVQAPDQSIQGTEHGGFSQVLRL